MLLSKIKRIENGRIIKKTKDGDSVAIRQGLEYTYEEKDRILAKHSGKVKFLPSGNGYYCIVEIDPHIANTFVDSKTKDADNSARIKELDDKINILIRKQKQNPEDEHEYNEIDEEIHKLQERKYRLMQSTDSKTKDEKFPVGSYIRVNVMGSKPERVVKRDGTTVWTNKGTYHETKVVAAESNDSKTKDSKTATINAQGSDWEVVIMDGTHLKMRLAGTENWATPLHFNQVRPEFLAALKTKGLVQGNYFVEDVYEPTAPKNIAAAKKMSVAQGKAAVGDKKVKDEAGDAHIRRISDTEYQVILGGKVVETYKGETAKEDAEEGLKHRVGDSKTKDAKTATINAQGKAAVGDMTQQEYDKQFDSLHAALMDAKKRGNENDISIAKKALEKLYAEKINIKDSFTGINSIKAELKEAEDDLARAKAKDGYEFVAKYKDWEVFRNEQTQTFPYIAYDKNANTIKGFSLVEIKGEIDKKGK